MKVVKFLYSIAEPFSSLIKLCIDISIFSLLEIWIFKHKNILYLMIFML